ncbi:expressed unknown protein [Seminavis robusta]|uniref:Lipoxygenase domain-containing protein n=1 Tax=Seminavis robusta TaxID=568900 RepID=A0A9N8EVE8_9STRA|nr:expressed unknown protein [Seminavis robusta]|eukprot:Sro2095_g314240.1 n/a (251) ;mRNA; r:9462-10214
MRTALINNKAGTALLPKQSILHHITGLTWDGLVDLTAKTYKKGDQWKCFKRVAESRGSKIQELVESGKLPYHQDGLELYKIFYSLWESVVPATDADVSNDPAIQDWWNRLKQYTESPDLPGGKLFSRETLLDTLATFCLHVTGGHQHVGSIAEHIETPLHGGFRMPHNAVQVDKQSYLGGSLLLAMTSLPVPSLQSKFAHYWKDEEEAAIWQKFQDDLIGLSERIDDRNQSRQYAFQSFNPAIVECSVSV